MFKIGLIHTKFYQASNIRPFFDSDILRDTFFENYVSQNGLWKDALNVVVNDNIDLTLTLKVDNESIEDLLRYNYCVLIYPDNKKRYFYAVCTQDSNKLLTVQLTLDDYTQNYNNLRYNNTRAMIMRASYDEREFVAGTNSLLNIPENVDEPKVMTQQIEIDIASSITRTFNNDNSLQLVRDFFNNQVWVYYFIKRNNITDTLLFPGSTYHVNNINTNHVVLCGNANMRNTSLGMVNSTHISLRWTGNIMANAEDINFFLSTGMNIPLSTANETLLRALQNSSSLSNSTNVLNLSLTPFLTAVKVSYISPFHLNINENTFPATGDLFSATMAAGERQLLANNNNSVIRGCTMINIVGNRQVCVLTSNLPNLEWDFPLDTNLRAINARVNYNITNNKIDSSEFKEIRLVTNQAQHMIIDDNKLPRGNGFDLRMYEEINADATTAYYNVSNMSNDAGHFYRFADKNYNGMMHISDTTLPIFIDALSTYFANNKNSINASAFDRQTSYAMQQSNIDTMRANNRDFVNPGRVLGLASNWGSNIRKTQREMANAERQNTLNYTNSAMQEKYKFKDLQYSPPQIAGAANILLNWNINGIKPVIQIYEVEETVKNKWLKYFDEYGYKINMIDDLSRFDNHNVDNKYLQADILHTEAKLSENEFNRIKNVMQQGVLRKNYE